MVSGEVIISTVGGSVQESFYVDREKHGQVRRTPESSREKLKDEGQHLHEKHWQAA